MGRPEKKQEEDVLGQGEGSWWRWAGCGRWCQNLAVMQDSRLGQAWTARANFGSANLSSLIGTVVALLGVIEKVFSCLRESHWLPKTCTGYRAGMLAYLLGLLC